MPGAYRPLEQVEITFFSQNRGGSSQLQLNAPSDEGCIQALRCFLRASPLPQHTAKCLSNTQEGTWPKTCRGQPSSPILPSHPCQLLQRALNTASSPPQPFPHKCVASLFAWTTKSYLGLMHVLYQSQRLARGRSKQFED